MNRSFARLLVALAFCGCVVAPVQAQQIEDLLGGGDAPAEQPEEPSIEAGVDQPDDADIRERLDGIYDELEPLQEVDVGVTNGIVTLGGTAASANAAERAVSVAKRVVGVVDVVDRMTVDANVKRRLATTFKRLRASALNLVAAAPVALLALAIVVAFWFLAGWVGRRRGVFRALAPNSFIAELLAGIARVAFTLLGVILALSLLDATSLIGTVLGAAGIVGLAVGFAVRDTVENYIASILLSLRTPFLANDSVQIDDRLGTVARLTSRATILISLDGNHIRIPNSIVYKAVIVNFTRKPERRFEFAIGVDADFDPNHAQALALETVHATPGVLDTPSGSALVRELGDSNVTIDVYAWVDQRENDILKVRSEAIRRVKQAFDAAGIVMPEPIYRLRLDERGAGGALLRRAIGTGAAEGEGDAGGAEGGNGDAATRDRVPDSRGLGGSGALERARDTSVDDTARAAAEHEGAVGDEQNLLCDTSARE